MHIRDILSGPNPSLSFEFFPPRSPGAWEELYQTIRELEALRPSFVSVTYGAGGTTREMTHDLVLRIKGSTAIPPVPHLTCVGHTQDEIDVWYRNWLKRTLDPVEARLAQLGAGDFLHGDAPGLFEIVLIPQLANARRFQYDLSASPHMTRIEAACLALPAFAAAHPDRQIDAP